MSIISKLVRNGSNSSTSSISLDTSAHNHVLYESHSLVNLKTWLDECWSPIDNRHERFATGSPIKAMAVLTREMMEMHIVQKPELRGMIDCLPVADRQAPKLMGWRKKLGTWPLSKHEALVAREFAA